MLKDVPKDVGDHAERRGRLHAQMRTRSVLFCALGCAFARQY